VLIVGCGYLGLALGAELARQRHKVFGLRRSGSTDAELHTAGISPLVGDVTDRASLAKLPASYDWVVNAVSSRKGGFDDYRAVYLDGTRNLLDWLDPVTEPAICWIGLIQLGNTSLYRARVFMLRPTGPW
jgi:nucleoside-diphosphate-sugar epimerase